MKSILAWLFLLAVGCSGLWAQSTFDTVILANFTVHAGPPAEIRPIGSITMRDALRDFHRDCTTTAGISNPSSTTFFSGSGVNLIRWGTGLMTVAAPNDPDNSILIVTGNDGISGGDGDSSFGWNDTDDSSVYVLGGNGDSGGNVGKGGSADCYNLGGSTGFAQAFGGHAFGSDDGGYAYAECSAGIAGAFAGSADDGLGGTSTAIGDIYAVAVGGDTTGASAFAGDAFATAANGDCQAFGGNSTGTTNSMGGAAFADATGGGSAFAFGGGGRFAGSAEAYAWLDAEAYGGDGLLGVSSGGGYAYAETSTGGMYRAYAKGGDGVVGGAPGTGGALADAFGPNGQVSNTPASGNSGEQEEWN